MKPCWEKMLDELDRVLAHLPRPLIEPQWYPGVPDGLANLAELLEQVGRFLHELAEVLVRALEDEGFFDENPLICVYPKYSEASGIVIYYKGRKVFEKWINTFEINWQNPEEVKREVKGWYRDVYAGGYPDESEYYYGPDWQVPR